jgi:hypothetical protein
MEEGDIIYSWAVIEGHIMDDYAEIIQIKITNRYGAFGYGIPEEYSSYYINVDGEIRPSEVTKIMESIIFSGETRITDWFTTEEKYTRSYAGASGGGFEFLLNISSGISANIITEIVKHVIKYLRPRGDRYTVKDALQDCYYFLNEASQIDKKDVILFEHNITLEEYKYIFKNKKRRRYYVINLNRKHEVSNYRVCGSIKEARNNCPTMR